jgi:predicted neuraminidase
MKLILTILGMLIFIGCKNSENKLLTEEQAGIVQEEFIYTEAPFPQCHASTIIETKNGLLAAWFGGTREKDPDVGIWISSKKNGIWSPPGEVANGIQEDGTRFPCWNPVLFRPKGGSLMLFYKVGASPREWWGMVLISEDEGKTWSNPSRLPPDILGPIKNKSVQLSDGTIINPSSTEHAGWRVHFERSIDEGKTWEFIGPVNDGEEFGAIQPTILIHPDGALQALCRSRQNYITECWSKDGGKTWDKMIATELPNPNAGIDAVTLRDGRFLLVYNHTIRGDERPRGREMLNVALSEDGKNWQAALILENELGNEFSYPAVIQTQDGLVHTTYTWKRERVKHVVIDPAKLILKNIENGTWPGM